MHRIADPIGNLGKWFAVALSDGQSDHVLYDSRADAVSHQHHNELYYAFVQIVPSTMNFCEAEQFLATHRKLYDAGFKLTDRDSRGGGRSLITRASIEDQRSLINAVTKGGRPANLSWQRREH